MQTANWPLPSVNEHTSNGTCASAHTYWQQGSYGVGHPAVLSRRPVHVDVGKGKVDGPEVVEGGGFVVLLSVVFVVVEVVFGVVADVVFRVLTVVVAG